MILNNNYKIYLHFFLIAINNFLIIFNKNIIIISCMIIFFIIFINFSIYKLNFSFLISFIIKSNSMRLSINKRTYKFSSIFICNLSISFFNSIYIVSNIKFFFIPYIFSFSIKFPTFILTNIFFAIFPFITFSLNSPLK